MTEDQAKKLEYPFTADEIEWRVLHTNKDKTKGQVAAYVDSRAIQYRLDGVLGRDNWKNDFVTVQGTNKDTTSHICTLSIYYPERKEWISKSDGAGSTDIEPVKGGLSNAFKRAASMWGIGRYLYGLTDVWATLYNGKFIADSEYPKLRQAYNAYVKKYLVSTSKTSEPVQTQKPHTKQAVAQGTEQKPVPQESRFVPKKQEPLLTNLYRIQDLKTARGRTGQQSLLTLVAPDGNLVSGYIFGEHDLKAGETIQSPKIVTKDAPNIGTYNVIESFQKAA